MPTQVSITHSPSLTDAAAIRASVASAISLVCDLREIISPGQTVVLKPNVFAPQRPPTTTDPRVVVAVGELCREAGAGRVRKDAALSSPPPAGAGRGRPRVYGAPLPIPEQLRQAETIPWQPVEA
jgi:uncharacterized protein (DUF362 family)